MIEIVFLGTSSMFPTKKRAHSSIFIRQGPNNFLFDCGEGTQRQMRIAGLSPMKLSRIFISHWHGDHALGLAGLLQSMSAGNRTEKLHIYGPTGTSNYLYHILKSFAFKLTFKVETHELHLKIMKKIIDEDNFIVEAMPLKHSSECIGFSLIEKGKRKINIDYVKKKLGIKQDPILGDLQKGKDIVYKGKKVSAKLATYMTSDKKLVYIADTKYFKCLEKFAKNADILISESTYGSDLSKKNEDYLHMKAGEAAQIAKDAKAKKLILTHFSQRYTSLKSIEDEAKKIFKDTILANDFDEFVIK